MSLKNSALLLALLIFFTQCGSTRYVSYPYKAPISYNSFNNLECLYRPKQVYVFYDGEPINFKYKRLGSMEYLGEPERKGTTAIQYLQHKAWLNCADGIIITNNAIRDVPTEFDEEDGIISSYKQAHVNAIAVKMEKDSSFYAQNGQKDESLVYTYIDQEIAEKAETTNSTSVFGALIGLALITAALISVDEEE